MKYDSFAGSKVRHGTASGWRKHRELHEPPCPPCYAAKAEYDAGRRDIPEKASRNRDRAKAQGRARSRLANLHPDEYRRLYEEAKAEIAEEPRALEELALAEDPTVPDEFVETR
jgi:hypothetical protein